MAKTLLYTKANRLTQLHEEILASVPSVQPAQGKDAMVVLGNGTQITLVVRDGADETAIAAVVAAHVPVYPPAPTPADYGSDATDLDTQAAFAVSNLRAYLNLGSPTAAQSAGALKIVIRCLLFIMKRLMIGS